MNNYDDYVHLMPSYVVEQNKKKARRTAIMFNVLGFVIAVTCAYFFIDGILGQIMGKFKAPIRISEDAIAECREKLVNELCYKPFNVTINDKFVHFHDMFEDAEVEDLFNIAVMLFVDKDDAHDHAVEILKKRFDILFSDAEIEAHLINEIEEDAAERHSQEKDEAEYCYDL